MRADQGRISPRDTGFWIIYDSLCEEFAFSVIAGDHTSTGVQETPQKQIISSKRNSHAQSLRQFLENLTSSTLGKWKGQIGKTLTLL